MADEKNTEDTAVRLQQTMRGEDGVLYYAHDAKVEDIPESAKLQIDPKTGYGIVDQTPQRTAQQTVVSPAAQPSTTASAPASPAPSTPGSTTLPNGFPARAALIKSGFDTTEKVKAASDEQLIAVDGVGEANLVKIREATK